MKTHTKQVTYMRGQAFLECDCKQGVVLAKVTYGAEFFTGTCPRCKTSYKLKNGKFQATKTNQPINQLSKERL